MVVCCCCRYVCMRVCWGEGEGGRWGIRVCLWFCDIVLCVLSGLIAISLSKEKAESVFVSTGTASANSAKFRRIRPRMYIDDLLIM